LYQGVAVVLIYDIKLSVGLLPFRGHFFQAQYLKLSASIRNYRDV